MKQSEVKRDVYNLNTYQVEMIWTSQWNPCFCQFTCRIRVTVNSWLGLSNHHCKIPTHEPKSSAFLSPTPPIEIFSKLPATQSWHFCQVFLPFYFLCLVKNGTSSSNWLLYILKNWYVKVRTCIRKYNLNCNTKMVNLVNLPTLPTLCNYGKTRVYGLY